MRVMRPIAAVTAVLLAAPAVVSYAQEKFDAKADLERLQGVWMTAEGVKPSVRLEVSKRGLGLRYVVKNNHVVIEMLDMDVFELKEVKEKHCIELTELAGTLLKTGRTIEYRLEKDTLVLKVPEGELKGEHKLTKAAVKK